MIDLKQRSEALKAHVDARDIARTLLGNSKQRPRYDSYRSPFRDDGKNADFAVYSDGYVDFGDTRTGGDVFELVQRVNNCTFNEAVEIVQRYASGTSSRTPQRAESRPTTGTSEPPTAEWQQAAATVLGTAQDYLWSGKSDALQALAYLHQQTLSDDTIRAFGLGINPAYRKFTGGDLPAGIVIPIRAGGALWRLSVRTNTPNRKYQNATGSKLSGLFNADAIQAGKPVLMVEGEKDAMVAQQALGNLATVVTLGGVSSKLSSRWRDVLQSASKVYVSLDNDKPGQDATVELVATLTGWGIQAQTLTIPAGKDATEYATEHGGDLRAWFEASTRFAWWPGQGVPDKTRAALNEYFPRSVALVVELINEAAGTGLINATDLIIEKVLKANRALGYNIPESTLKRTLQSPEFEFISVLETVFDDFSMSKTDFNSNKRSKVGRPETHYRCVSVDEFKQIILKFAAPRIYEEAHPVHTTDPVMARVTSSIMRDAVDTTEDYENLAREVNQITSEAFQKQDIQKQRAGKRAMKHKCELIEELNDITSTRLPIGWSKSTAIEYKAAFVHAFVKGRSELIASRRDMQHLFGLSNGSLDEVIAVANLNVEQQFAILKLDDATDLHRQIEQARHDVNGYPKYVQVGEGDTVKEFAYDPDNLDEIRYHVERGAVVNLKYQTANRYTPGSDTPAIRENVSKSRLTKFKYSAPKTDRLNGFKPFYGAKYNPTWITAQLRLMLVGIGWKRQAGNLINPDGGELLDSTASPRDLIEVLLNRTLAPSNREIYREIIAAEMESLGYRKAVTGGNTSEFMRGAP
jgi:hypothetical protein